ncbi:hypothetical protein Pint_21289 [Pistacia integerrima]|uniref:Uncharacterized protein n=1 Tax=Pistacia integerrima TaxID=434235 RepID=A0ACC0XD49_9ROSI|nr:hypothetical protein Pint_21289 [Pistacia integerrima]
MMLLVFPPEELFEVPQILQIALLHTGINVHISLFCGLTLHGYHSQNCPVNTSDFDKDP